LTTAEHWPESLFCVMSGAQPIVGSSLSITVNANEQLACRPSRSVAVQPTLVAPLGNTEPTEGEQLILIGAQPPLVAGAVSNTAEHSPGSVVLVSWPGHTKIKLGVSPTVSTNAQLVALPLESAVVQLTV
jgi:hypothetical protein